MDDNLINGQLKKIEDVVESILKMYGGEIRVSHLSNPTTFEIFLPRKIYS